MEHLQLRATATLPALLQRPGEGLAPSSALLYRAELRLPYPAACAPTLVYQRAKGTVHLK